VAQSYRDLVVWQWAYQLALAVYRVTQQCPQDDMLCDELRGAAVALPAAVARGADLYDVPGALEELNNALLTCTELEVLAYLSRDLGVISAESCSELLTLQRQVIRLLKSFIRRVRMLATQDITEDSHLYESAAEYGSDDDDVWMELHVDEQSLSDLEQ
jgi:four helix bundle protein